MQRRKLIAALAVTSVVSGMTFAQDNSRPLRIVVPFPPGGATDIAGRSLQEPLQRLLGQPVVIENKAGAGGSIGMAEVARATDGLTFGVATLSTHGVNPAVLGKLPYDPIKDFVGVTEIVKAPGIIVVNPKVLPVKDFADLVKHLKAHPGKVEYATPGNGTIGHMWGELFKSATGTSMVHIPYRGAGPAINDVLGGQVPVYFDQVASSLPHVKAGKLKALAVSWHERLAVLPDVPTLAEVGLPNVNRMAYYGIIGPKGLPKDIVDKVNAAVHKVLKDPAVRKRIEDTGSLIVADTPAKFAQEIKAEYTAYKNVVDKQKLTMN